MNHAADRELEAFVMGLPLRDPEGFRAHVLACSECAARLAEAARCEVVLREAAGAIEARESSGVPHLVECDRPGAEVRRSWIAAAAALLVIVAGAVWIASRDASLNRSSPTFEPRRAIGQSADPASEPARAGYDVLAAADLGRTSISAESLGETAAP